MYLTNFIPERIKDFLIYATKCAVGTIIILTLTSIINGLTYYDTIWCLLSMLLILSPDGMDSVTLAFNRIMANILGAGVGLMFITLLPQMMDMWILILVIITTLAIGYAFKLDASLRSALVAAIIITMPQDAIQSMNTPIERVIAVISGCFIGVAITYAFHFRKKNIFLLDFNVEKPGYDGLESKKAKNFIGVKQYYSAKYFSARKLIFFPTIKSFFKYF